MRLRPLYPERDFGDRAGVWVLCCGSAKRTSCGRTSGTVCCTPQPAAAAPRRGSFRRWTPPGGCGWDTVWCVSGNGSLLCLSTPGCGGEGRGPIEQGDTHDTWLKRKNLRIGGNGSVPREKLRNWGTVKGHLLLKTPEEGLRERLGPLLTCCPHEAGC